MKRVLPVVAMVGLAGLIAAIAILSQRGPAQAPAQAPAATAPATAAADKSAVEVVAVSVAALDKTSEFNVAVASSLLPGTFVHLAYTTKEHFIVTLEEQGTALETFKDDKGADLPGRQDQGRTHFFGMFPQISDDGSRLVFSIESPQVPSKGAREITVKGKIIAVVGKDEKKASHKDVAIKKGSKVEAGPFKADMGVQMVNDNTQVHLRAATFEGIKKVAFFDASGKEIPSKKTGWNKFGNLMTHVFDLTGKFDKATIEVTYFAGREKITIPFDNKASVGL